MRLDLRTIFCATFLFFATANSCQAAQAPASTAPAMQSWSDHITSTLGINNGGEDALPLIVNAIGQFTKGDVDGGNETLDSLAREVAAGGANLADYNAQASLAAHIPPTGTVLGTRMSQRTHLFRIMWSRAKLLYPSSPVLASQLARAALALAVHDELQPKLGMIYVLLSAEWDRFRVVAALDHTQEIALVAQQQRIQKYENNITEASLTAQRSTDAIISMSPDAPIPDAAAKEALSNLGPWKNAATAPGGDIDLEYPVIFEAWTLKNLGVARKNGILQSGAIAFLQNWQSELDGRENLTSRWLQEALVNSGAPPARPRVVDAGPGWHGTAK